MNSFGSEVISTKETKRIAFRNKTGELDSKLIEFYLSRADWNYQIAIAFYENSKEERTKIQKLITCFTSKESKNTVTNQKLARFYLSETNWCLKQAKKLYKSDTKQMKKMKAL